MAALLRLACRDADALVVAVACLLPGLRKLVRRHRARLGADTWPAALVELCDIIRRHRYEQEPGRLARRLLAAVHDRLRTLGDRAATWASRTVRLDVLTGDGRTAGVVSSPEESTSFLLPDAIRAGVISPQTAVLIAGTDLDDRPLGEVAEHLHLGYEATVKRRQRGRTALAHWLMDDREAA